MFLKNKKFWIGLTGAILTLVIAGEAFWFWASVGPLTNAKKRLFSIFPIPIAKVGNHTIFSNEFLTRFNQLNSYGQSNQNNSENLALGQLVREKQLEILAQSKGLIPQKHQIEAEYSWQKYSLEKKDKTNLEQTLFNKNITIEDYKNQIVGYTVLVNNLKIWFYSQKDLNPESYKTATEVLDRLSKGENFSSLAQTFSQDQQSKMFSGDVGFKTQDSLLPELKEQTKNVGEGQTRVVVTRYGLEIIKVEGFAQENGEKTIHLKHILIKGADFNSWLESQIKTIVINQYIKF